jgi:hypothetical protein
MNLVLDDVQEVLRGEVWLSLLADKEERTNDQP